MAETTKPGAWQMPEGDYAGDVKAAEVWETLAGDPAAVLVDVRTEVEWNLIGKPELSGIAKEPIFLQWVKMGGLNKNFVSELKAALEDRGVARDAPVYFMCQSGGRSKMAAMQCAALGYTRCYNIADGFEGDLDEHRHRNSVSGWKVAGLPWYQS
jgi:rhodanese-related sulfurtransferase